MSLTRTKINILGRDILVEVSEDAITMRRFGDRAKRVIAVEKLWDQLAHTESEPPPLTMLTKVSIVAYFSRVRPSGQSNLWIRADTGEELTEKEIMKAGRREKKPVRLLYGIPFEKAANA